MTLTRNKLIRRNSLIFAVTFSLASLAVWGWKATHRSSQETTALTEKNTVPRILDRNQSGLAVISLPRDTPDAVGLRIAERLERVPTVSKVRWIADSSSLSVSHDLGAGGATEMLEEIGTDGGKDFAGETLSYVLTGPTEDQTCACHALELFNKIEATPGVIRVARFVPGDEGIVRIVIDPDEIAREEVEKILTENEWKHPVDPASSPLTQPIDQP